MPHPFVGRRQAVALVATAALVALAGCGSRSSSAPSGSAVAATSSSTSAAAVSRQTCPLTGEPASSGQHPNGVAVAVKVDNIAPALPQAGITHADVVVEELVEGGLTRLVAVFGCDSATVGPIRSARITDADLVALLHGSILAFSGANPADLPPIEAHGDAVLLSQDNAPQLFTTDSARPAPHDVFASTSSLVAAGKARRHSLTAPKPLFSYGSLDSAATPARSVSLTWPAASASWTWSHGVWLRDQDGTADKVVGGAQVHASNVVVLSVPIASTGLHDVLGTPVPLDVTVGSGTTWVFRNGHVVRGTWKRKAVSSPLVLHDHRGRVIDLAPGHTWVELLPNTGSAPAISR